MQFKEFDWLSGHGIWAIIPCPTNMVSVRVILGRFCVYFMLYKVILTFKSVDETLMCDHSNECYWAVLSCGTVYYAVNVELTFQFCGWNLVCDHSNEIYWAVLLFGTVYYAVQGGSNFEVCGWNSSVWPSKWKLLNSTFMWYCLLYCRWF